MSLHIHNIRFRQLYCEHMRTNDQLFFNKSFFFSKIMFESWGCGLYTRFFLVFVHEHRLMSTVLEFFSVRFTSGKNQNLIRVTSKLPWWKIEHSSGVAWNELLKRGPAGKTISVNWNNQCYISFDMICPFIHTCNRQRKRHANLRSIMACLNGFFMAQVPN